ncbi:MAG: adenylosuccinate synthase [Deltaproteobacteria bacterium]|nr:adenylosuccinate synthase [Deltaproteobacteria bacterium]
MSTVVIIGSQWGDEGKGKIVDIYTEYAEDVVRFQGGNNAGHTLVVGNETTVMHIIPSGILHPGKRCLIGNGVVLDPQVFFQEAEKLKAKGYFQNDAQLMIDPAVHIIMPYHRTIDVAREKMAGQRKIGTTGRGIGPAYEDKVGRRGIRLGDLIHPERFAEKLREALPEKNFLLEKFLGEPPLDEAAIFDEYRLYGEKLRKFLGNTAKVLHDSIAAGNNILLEGAQGTLLDIDHGTYPFVTSSSTVAGGACTGTGIGPCSIDAVIGISKAYVTRVGEGPFPTELKDETGELLRREGHEYGATTGRPRRTGWLDMVALRKAVQLNGLTGLALTKLDVLNSLATIRICSAYRCDGKLLSEFPTEIGVLQRCEPVFEEVPGWQCDIRAVTDLEQLPPASRDFISKVEKMSGCPVVLVSVGPRRDQTIQISNPFRSKG